MIQPALKEEFITYVEMLEPEKVGLALAYLRGLAEDGSKLRNSKTEQERKEAAKALSELDKMNFAVKDSSIDGRKEKSERLWRKYESLS